MSSGLATSVTPDTLTVNYYYRSVSTVHNSSGISCNEDMTKKYI